MPRDTSDRTRKPSVAQDAVARMSTSPFNMNTPSPLGALSVLPREIRDEIYRNLFAEKKYFWHNIMFSTIFTSPSDAEYAVSVLRLSKAFNEEAIPIMYSEGTFCFRYALQEPTEFVGQHDSIYSMTKVEFFYDASLESELNFNHNEDLDWNLSRFYDCARAGSLDLFQGDTIVRDSIIIVLLLCEFWGHAAMLIESPLFVALKQLTGFKAVTLRLAIEEEECDAWPRPKLFRRLRPIIKAMSEFLEPTLGKSIVVSELPADDPDAWLLPSAAEVFEIVFHPQDHQTAVSRKKRENAE